ncbi:MAG: exonuclease domain-containing protein [Candidatus Dormibacteria bacterium]
MSWVDSDWLAFDTESTGVATDVDRIVTAALLRVPGGSTTPSEDLRWVINPGIEVPAAAAKIHGYDTARVQREGVAPLVALMGLVAALRKSWTPDVPLVIVNAPFDLSLLDAECHRHLGRPLDLSGPVLDPMVCDRALDKYRKGGRTLTHLCAHYGVSLTEAHSSSADALAGLLVMRALIDVHEQQMRRCTLEEMQAHQRRWKKDQAESLESYFRGKKRQEGATAEEVAAVVVDRSWPMRTLVELSSQ